MNATDEQQRALARRVKKAALLGFLLTLACHMLPADLRAPCEVLAGLCTGSFR